MIADQFPDGGTRRGRVEYPLDRPFSTRRPWWRRLRLRLRRSRLTVDADKAAADRWVDENTEYDTIDELLAYLDRVRDRARRGWIEDTRRYYDEMRDA